jgi:hypothetical protein
MLRQLESSNYERSSLYHYAHDLFSHVVTQYNAYRNASGNEAMQVFLSRKDLYKMLSGASQTSVHARIPRRVL